jgi:hypothetical protein
MGKTRHLLILMVVLVVALGLAVPAMGKVDCDQRPDHPQCGTGEDPPTHDLPAGGTVCDPANYPDDIVINEDGFTFTLRPDDPWACIDVVAAAGEWDITVTGSRARSLLLVGRDSIAPGDACDALSFRRDAIYGSHSLAMPAATINACGTGYPEWVSLETPEFEESDCVKYDEVAYPGQCLVADMVDVTHPLVLQADMSGFSDGWVTIDVTLP